jgi:hypothetical protein
MKVPSNFIGKRNMIFTAIDAQLYFVQTLLKDSISTAIFSL